MSDSGPGISEEDQPFIFDRFWRAASARALPGSGLGLSIVAQVVAELDGTVSVDRDPNLGGARFTISLPVVETDMSVAQRTLNSAPFLIVAGSFL